MCVSINFEGNENNKSTNANASTNDLLGTKEHHEEETSTTTVNPNDEKKVTGSSIHSIIFVKFSNIHYNLTISYVR